MDRRPGNQRSKRRGCRRSDERPHPRHQPPRMAPRARDRPRAVETPRRRWRATGAFRTRTMDSDNRSTNSPPADSDVFEDVFDARAAIRRGIRAAGKRYDDALIRCTDDGFSEPDWPAAESALIRSYQLARRHEILSGLTPAYRYPTESAIVAIAEIRHEHEAPRPIEPRPAAAPVAYPSAAVTGAPDDDAAYWAEQARGSLPAPFGEWAAQAIESCGRTKKSAKLIPGAPGRRGLEEIGQSAEWAAAPPTDQAAVIGILIDGANMVGRVVGAALGSPGKPPPPLAVADADGEPDTLADLGAIEPARAVAAGVLFAGRLGLIHGPSGGGKTTVLANVSRTGYNGPAVARSTDHSGRRGYRVRRAVDVGAYGQDCRRRSAARVSSPLAQAAGRRRRIAPGCRHRRHDAIHSA